MYASESARLSILSDYIQPVTPTFPPLAPKQAPVLPNDSFTRMAERFYEDPGFTNSLATTNGQGGGNNPHAGEVVGVPTQIESHNYANETEPYWELLSTIIPSMYPDLKTPQKHHHHSILGDIIAVVVTVVVMVFAPQLLGAVMPHILALMTSAAMASTVSQGI